SLGVGLDAIVAMDTGAGGSATDAGVVGGGTVAAAVVAAGVAVAGGSSVLPAEHPAATTHKIREKNRTR
ncbi:MAG: hypothetical protein KDH08_05615, partial [Anaerolineae bacterium]|nr:hypothetical protein [Anaerolineae bacterium]